MKTNVSARTAPAGQPTTSPGMTPAIAAWLKGGRTPRSMTVSITGLKHMASLSEETNAYTATILLDGVRAFEGSNRGHGGPDMYHRLKGYEGPDPEEVDAWLRATMPTERFDGMDLEQSLETVVGDLVESELRTRRLKRLLSTRILVIDKAEGGNALYTYKGKPTPENLQAIRTSIAAGRTKGRLVNDGGEAIMTEALALV